MAEFKLPEKSTISQGKHYPGPARAHTERP